MNPNLQPLLKAAQKLPLIDQWTLIKEILQIRYGKTDFQKNIPDPEIIDKMLENKPPVSPITDLKKLKADFWPEDESADDFIDFIYEQRNKDRLQ